MSRPVFLLNGPNLNLLGKQLPQIYGHETLADAERDCHAPAQELELELRFHQNNRQYEIIDWVHEAREIDGGLIINPGVSTHASVAILDALNTFDEPVIEVHISNVHKREDSVIIPASPSAPTESWPVLATRAVRSHCAASPADRREDGAVT
jgi:3-dehydroquinate dehydratase-2